MRAGIVGLGLIGGSFAKAYSEAGHEVLAFDRNESVLSFAQIEGAVSAPLTKENITGIIDLQIDALNKRLSDKQLHCELTEAAKQLIIDTSYDPQFGARPLRRYVQHTVETLLAKKILEGSVQPGSTITVDTENGELVLR